MNEIRIGPPERRRTDVRIPISTEGLPERFVTGDMRISYGRSVSDVPTSIHVLPAVGNLLPIAWASNSELRVAELDRRFARAVDEIRGAFNEMYPDLESDRVLRPDGTPRNDAAGSKSMLLFSGGVDSLASYVRHRRESPVLVSIHGGDIGVENRAGWERARRNLQHFAEQEATELVTVESNFRSVLEYPLLDSNYRESITANWWAGVQHGLAMLTHCAPLAYELGASTLYIAATHTAEFSPPWGSCPDIDDAVEWAGTAVHHDGYELSRQEKIEQIARFAGETDRRFTIRSCYESEAGRNCSRCEKCCRTIVGLEIAGVDPETHGYRVDDETFERICTAFETGRWDIGRDEAYMWRDLQRNLPPDDPPHGTSSSFFEWFRRQDITSVRRTSQDSTELAETVEPYLKYLPDSGYRALKLGKRLLSD